MFLDKFAFCDTNSGMYGVEREFFLVDWLMGKPVPLAASFLREVGKFSSCPDAWTCELTACQVKHRSRPHNINVPEGIFKLHNDLFTANQEAIKTALSIGYKISDMPVAPADMHPRTYPDARYDKIVARISPDVLFAACRVAGMHIHVGASSMKNALHIYNRLVSNIDRLMMAGDGCSGERLKLYCMMAPNWRPPPYRSVNHFENVANDQGFAENPRDCWHLIRISVHGTVELRMFDTSLNTGKIQNRVSLVQRMLR